MAAHVVVIGGGVAGLTAALDLVDAGAGVTVLDAADRVGGKLRTEVVAGATVDVGAEAMLSLRPEGPDLARRAGVGERLTAPSTSASGLWTRGEIRRLPSPSLMGVPTDPESARGILTDDELARLLDERPGTPVSGDVSVGDLVAERLGDAVVDRLLDPLLGGVYAGDARALSLRAAVPQLGRCATEGTSLLAAAAAVPPRTPEAPSVFAGLVGGMGSLPLALEAVLTERGATVRTGATVRGLRREGSGWSVLVGPTNDPEWVSADAVVVATPPPAAGRLLADVAPRAAELVAGVEVASMGIITLAFERDALGDLPGSGFLVPAVDGRAIKASTFSSAKWGWLAEAHPDLAFVRTSVGRMGETATLQRPDDDLVALSLADLGEALGRTLPDPVDTLVHRWGGAIPQYAVGHLDRVAEIRAGVAGLPGLALAGAAYDGVGIAAVIASAHRAAAELRDQLSLAPDQPRAEVS